MLKSLLHGLVKCSVPLICAACSQSGQPQSATAAWDPQAAIEAEAFLRSSFASIDAGRVDEFNAQLGQDIVLSFDLDAQGKPITYKTRDDVIKSVSEMLAQVNATGAKMKSTVDEIQCRADSAVALCAVRLSQSVVTAEGTQAFAMNATAGLAKDATGWKWLHWHASAATAPEVAIAPPPSKDPADVGPDIYKKVFENANVRAFEVTFKPGAKIAAHTHPDHVVYVLSGGKLRVTPAGAAAQDLELKAGQAVYLAAQEHSAENIGTTELKLVVVELRAKPTAVAPAGADPIAVGPAIYKKVLDHERVRVLEMSFKKGAQIAAHTHPDHFAYVISAGKLRVTPVGKPAQEFEVQPGQGVYMPAEAHSAQNVGASEVKGVAFELKP